MKRGVPKFSISDLRFSLLIRRSTIGIRQLRLALVIIAFWLIIPAYSQTKDMVLLLEQTPVKGGKITPVAGVHYFKPNSEVILTAVPKAGYKFIHWLGDVSDPTAANTIVYLNEPKVIIAVFEKAEQGISGDGEGLLLGGGGAKPKKPVYYEKGKKPTPEVPEPATGLLMMLGGLFALKRRSPKRITG